MKINQRVMSFKNLRHQCFICLFFEIHLESLDSSKCHRDDVNMTSRVGVGGGGTPKEKEDEVRGGCRSVPNADMGGCHVRMYMTP